jgi:hypothetical protein
MKPTVVVGMAQPYPGYGCQQVTIVAAVSRIRSLPLVKHVTICSVSLFCFPPVPENPDAP